MSDLPLYWRHPELTDCYCKIVEARPAAEGGDGTWDLVLENSPFYPGGGGQPADRGFLGEEALQAIIRKDDMVFHRVKSSRDLGGARTIRCRVDEAYRRDSMQQHSGQHLLSAALALEGLDTMSVHLGADYCGIEVDANSVSKDLPERVLGRCDTWIAENRSIISRIVESDDRLIGRLRRPLKSSADKVRIIEIEGVDAVGCGGVHLRNTAAVTGIVFAGSEKMRRRLRLKWIIGDRLIQQARQQSAILAGACRELSVEAPELSSRINTLLLENRESTRKLAASEKKIGDLLCRRALAEAAIEASNEKMVLAVGIGGASDRMQGALEAAQSLSVKASLFLGEAGPDGSRPWGIHLCEELADQFSPIREELITVASGRGGGRFPFWRGVIPGEEEAILKGFLTVMNRLLPD